MDWFSEPKGTYGWMVEIAIGIFVLVAIYFILQKGLKQIRRHSLAKELEEMIRWPVTIILWTLGAILVIEVLSKRFEFSFFDRYLEPFRTTVIVAALSWCLLRWKKAVQYTLLHKSSHGSSVDAGVVHVIGRILSIVILIIFSMIIMQVWGVNLGPLIAFGGIGAAAIGFAAKDVIGNFFGGLMLYMTRPFVMGDLVILPGQQLEGHVEEIGWYLTAIRDKDKRPVYLPNAIFSNTLVINSSRMTHRRILETISVRYSDFNGMNQLCQTLQAKISAHPSIDTHLPVLVHFHSMGEYSLNILIDVYTLATRYDQYLSLKQEILSLVYAQIKEAGADVPLPAMQIMLEGGDSTTRRPTSMPTKG